MKRNKLLSMLLVLILVMSFLCGCGGGSSESGDDCKQTGGEAVISVTDQKGRVIELSEPAKRVVALTASDCEIIYALGAEETLVGRGEYCT